VGSAAAQTYYLHRNYLGSITQITDNSANLAAEYSYDAWGRMRNPANWQVYAATAQPTPMFGRGYTGHEHLNQFGLINMNARLYDPLLARFMAPDPQVSSPEASNGYNRYMYALDNPMMYTDINGEEGGPWWQGGNNNYPSVPYRPDYNPNPGGTGQGFYNPYGGPDTGYQGSGYTGYQGGYYGGGGSGELAFLVPLIYSYVNSQNGYSGRPQMKLSGDPTTHSYIKGSPAPAPAGLGSPRVSSGAGSRGGGNGLGNFINNAISVIGTLAGDVQLGIYNDYSWLGKNFKYNIINWGGNMYTGARSTALKISTPFKYVGKSAFWASSAYSSWKIGDGIINDKPQQIFFSSMNLIHSTIALKGGLIGAFVSTPYLLIDNTVGMDKVWEYNNNIQIEKAERASKGDYRLFFYPRFGQSQR